MNIAFINQFDEPLINIGLTYVISSIERDHKVRLLDMSFHAKKYSQYVLSSLREFKPDVIGFSVTSFSFPCALRTASLIRSLYPEIPLVYGGVHPTLLPEETIQNPLVDAICIGEGEDSFREYLQRLQNHQGPKDVAGIWYKNASGDIIRNPLRPFREDLDSLPFPNWDHWEIEKYLYMNESSFIGGLRQLASRGCPYSCTFCSNPAIRKAVPGKFYRLRNPENVIEEIKINVDKYYSKGFRHVVFADETFGMDMGHFKSLFQLYKKEGFHKYLTWSCQTRADLINAEWTDIAKESACAMVGLGIESGDENIRINVYKKKFTNKQIYMAIENLKKAGINYTINIIIGCPEDSRESLNASWNFLKETKPYREMFHLYQPLPKTELLDSIDNKMFNERVTRMFQSGMTHLFNAPMLDTKYLKVKELKMVLFMMRVNKICRFLMRGFKFKKFVFIYDIIRYIFYPEYKSVRLLNPHSFTDLESKTVVRYILEEKRKVKL